MRPVGAAVAVIAGILVVSGCGSAHPTPTVRAWVGVGLGPIAADVRLARASNRIFSIFPTWPSKRRCAIPHTGLLQEAYRGTCQTRFRPALVHSPGIMIVAFTERWRKPECALDLDIACSHPMAHHTWQVIEGTRVVTGEQSFKSRRPAPAAPRRHRNTSRRIADRRDRLGGHSGTLAQSYVLSPDP
jgi:hypothetical protein